MKQDGLSRMPAFMRNFYLHLGAGGPPYLGDSSADAQIHVRYRDDAVTTEGHLVCMADVIPPSAFLPPTSARGSRKRKSFDFRSPIT
jgi:hypothetical protein